MDTPDLPKFPTRHGYMTKTTQLTYIEAAIKRNLLPPEAQRIAEIVSLTAPSDPAKPIQFWQLHSVLGIDPVVGIVQNFYERVFADEDWFTVHFKRVGGIGHHINTQASMWVDVMGGGPYYHGADYRLGFHHTHNAIELMTETGAERWTNLMIETLDACADMMTDDPRVRISINTFLTHFAAKYAQDFNFENTSVFGETNRPYPMS